MPSPFSSGVSRDTIGKGNSSVLVGMTKDCVSYWIESLGKVLSPKTLRPADPGVFALGLLYRLYSLWYTLGFSTHCLSLSRNSIFWRTCPLSACHWRLSSMCATFRRQFPDNNLRPLIWSEVFFWQQTCHWLGCKKQGLVLSTLWKTHKQLCFHENHFFIRLDL